MIPINEPYSDGEYGMGWVLGGQLPHVTKPGWF